jgi:hypothetical protein
MNEFYTAIGISKQAFYQQLERYNRHQDYRWQLLFLIQEVREDHPTMGCRDMYYKILPEIMGRDRFEHFCSEEGLMSNRRKNPARTTDSQGVKRFANLIEYLEITHINQVWQSDISYFNISGRFYYLTFIIEACSRKIVGHQVSKRLYTSDTTLPALKKAIKSRGGKIPQGLILHSDGGGQYYADEFIKVTANYGIRNSMCKYAWENGKAERINGVIKNNYLIHRKINTFDELVKEVDRSVYLYNDQKPHIALQRKTPNQFEKDYFCRGEKFEDKPISDRMKKSLPKGYSALGGSGEKFSDETKSL